MSATFTHRVPRLIDDVHPGIFCFVFVPTHHVDRPTWTQNTSLYFLSPESARQRAHLLQRSPLLAIAMAVALPIPLLAPVIMKDLPTTDTFRSWGSKSLDAASYPFLYSKDETHESTCASKLREDSFYNVFFLKTVTGLTICNVFLSPVESGDANVILKTHQLSMELL